MVTGMTFAGKPSDDGSVSEAPMVETREATITLVASAVAAADAVEPSLELPLNAGWRFDRGESGGRAVQSTLQIDLRAFWSDENLAPKVKELRSALVMALEQNEYTDLLRLGAKNHDSSPSVVAQALAFQVLDRTAGLLTGAGRWEFEERPSVDVMCEQIADELAYYLKGVDPYADLILPLHLCSTDLVDPVELTDGVRLVPLDAGHRTRLLAGTMGTYHLPTASQANGWHVAVVCRYQPDVSGALDTALTRASDAVSALRLLRRSAVTFEQALLRPLSLSLTEVGSSIQTGNQTWGRPLKITAPDIAVLQQRMAEPASERSGRLALALRQLLAADSKRECGDRVIDCWTGLEALHIPDGSAELNYRLSLRLAYALGKDESEREKLFAAAKKSYTLRSQLVHGDPKAATKADADRLDEVEEWLRLSILRWWGTTSGPGQPELDAGLFA
jgi:hypothetical protein